MSSIKKIFSKLFSSFSLQDTKVVANERLSPHFQFLTIKGNALKNSDWVPGHKIKVALSGDEKRSYTPSSWDRENGVMQTLVYMHGKGPGALWARDVKPKSKVKISSPGSPLPIEPHIKSVLFFGDETTFGLAHALKKYSQTHYQFFFESTDTQESLGVLQKMDLTQSRLVELNKLDLLAQEINGLFKDPQFTKIILSGKQQSIALLREKLYALGLPKESIGIKVYWGWKDDPNGKLKK